MEKEKSPPQNLLSLPQFPSHPTCTKCELHTVAKSVGTPSVWYPRSLPPRPDRPEIWFLGQNPGFNEDQKNEPFIGKSGFTLKLAYIEGSSLHKLASCFLSNTARCYHGRDTSGPKTSHYKACYTHFLRDLTSLFPPERSRSGLGIRCCILCLGAPAASQTYRALAGEKVSLTKALARQGTPVEYEGRTFHVFATYHPAFVLRKRSMIHAVQDHLQVLQDFLTGKSTQPSKPSLIEKRGPSP